jgi:WD40 repeat protein
MPLRPVYLSLLLFLLPSLAVAQTPAANVDAAVRAAPRGTAASNSVHFSPDGSRAATVQASGEVAVWDTESGERLASFPAQDRYTYGAKWTPDGSLLACTSVDGTIQLRDPATGALVREFDQFSSGSQAMGGGITEVHFSPDERYMAAMQRFPEGRVVVWDLEADTETVRIERPRNVYDVGWNDDGSMLYTAEENGAVYGWSFPEGEPVAEYAVSDDLLFDMDVNVPWISTGGGEGTVFLIHTETGQVRRFDQGEFVNRTHVVPGTPVVAGVSSDGRLHVWNGDTGALRFDHFAHDDNTYFVTSTPDRTLLATVGRDRYVRFWDPKTGDLVREIKGVR